MKPIDLAPLLFAIVLTVALPEWGRCQSPTFNRDIRPILAENCFPCHGPDSAAREADLRLDKRKSAIDMGAISPGDVEGSELVRRILSDDDGEIMPPADSHKQLTTEQKKLLQKWVAAGAEYEPHWSFIAPTLPPTPVVSNPAWVRNPIDAFILERMERAGLKPSPEADLATLVRRVTLDLTGLPPTPEELNEVLDDPSPDAYEHYIDRTLAKPQWGEHRGRYWLDYARYADTHGIHFDNYREVWSYRDWVINAFNDNLPFDRFTIEQLAGDLLPSPSLNQQIATGFNRCNITTNEGGAINEEYLVLYTRDRVETTSLVWLGMTTGCAVCHDHKFDPFSQKEFYQLAAFFNNTVQNAMDGNIKDTPPVVPVPVPSDRSRYVEIKKLIVDAEAAIQTSRESSKPAYESWINDSANYEQFRWTGAPPRGNLHLHLPLDDGSESSIGLATDKQLQRVELPKKAVWEPGWIGKQAWKNQGDGQPTFPTSGDFERDQAYSVGGWLRLAEPNQGGAVIARMDDKNDYRGWDVWLQDGRIAMHLIHQWPQNGLKVVGRPRLSKDTWQHVFITHDGSGKAAGVKIFLNGSPVVVDVERDTLSDTTRTQVPLKLGSRNSTSPTNNLLLQGWRIYSDAISPAQINELKNWERVSFLLGKAVADRTPDESTELFDWYLNTNDPAFRELLDRRQQLADERRTIEQRGTMAHVMAEKSDPPVAFVLHRGEYDQRGEQVTPSTPEVLPAMPDDLPRNRLGFAQWLLRPEHPLTARVTVNRFWQELFGQGLVASAGDFGISGELPTHPELLDYLAVSFRENGWNVKDFFKQLVTSSTYRQSAVVTPEQLAIDPNNELILRGPRFRMDAEMVRDYALATSHLLVPTIGGPSVRPYQPPGVWEAVAMPESDTRNYKADDGQGLYRRSMYTLWKRAAPPASMDIMNAPNRETCTIRRDRTNTPLQALLTLNDPQFIEAARNLAQYLLLKNRDSADRDSAAIEQLGWILVSRSFTDDERKIIHDSLVSIRESYKAQPAQADELLAVGESKRDMSLDAVELAAWTMLVNQVMNLDEVLNK